MDRDRSRDVAVEDAWGFFSGAVRQVRDDPAFRPGEFVESLGLDRPAPRRDRAVLVNVPFCAQRCSYCTVGTMGPGDGPRLRAYVDAVLATLDRYRATPAWGSGTARMAIVQGGTPTDLPVDDLGRLVRAVRQGLPLAPDAAVCVEAHAGRCEADRVAVAREAGANMLFVGVQSLQADTLRRLGCHHGPRDVEDVCRMARDAGFPVLAAYVLVGAPGQTVDQVREMLSTLAAWGVNAVFVLPLHGAGFVRPFEEVRDLFLAADDWLIAEGFAPVYHGTYQRPANGAPVRFTSPYQRFHLDVFAAGAGELGAFGGRRYGTLEDPDEYVAAVARGGFPVGFAERPLVQGERIAWWVAESLVLLRVEPEAFERQFDLFLEASVPALEQFVEEGLLVRDGEALVPTRLGRVLTGRMVAELLVGEME